MYHLTWALPLLGQPNQNGLLSPLPPIDPTQHLQCQAKGTGRGLWNLGTASGQTCNVASGGYCSQLLSEYGTVLTEQAAEICVFQSNPANLLPV